MPVNTATYHSIPIDGVQIFFRKAEPADAPVILLLHGFPSSSRMFAGLMELLADRYHLIAPDYPGFGHSDAPDPQAFAYTFDHLAAVVDGFTVAIGGPVGFKLWSSRMPSPTRKAWGRFGKLGAPTGEIAAPTKKSSVPTSRRLRPRSSGISAPPRIRNAMIRTAGPMNTRSFPVQVNRQFKAICSTTTGPT